MADRDATPGRELNGDQVYWYMCVRAGGVYIEVMGAWKCKIVSRNIHVPSLDRALDIPTTTIAIAIITNSSWEACY